MSVILAESNVLNFDISGTFKDKRDKFKKFGFRSSQDSSYSNIRNSKINISAYIKTFNGSSVKKSPSHDNMTNEDY